MTRYLQLPTLAAAICAGGVATGTMAATTIDVAAFSAADYSAKLGGFATVTLEDFEDDTAGEFVDGGGAPTPFASDVGTFETLGGTGSGGTVTGTPGNTGKGLFLRDASVFGRSNTTSGGSNFLDSNDTLGMEWTVSGLGLFDRILFTLSDASDTGADLTVSADGTDLTTFLDGQPNGTIDTILIGFDTAVSSAVITLENTVTNDGFGVDDAAVGLAPIPVPPALALMGGGLALLAGLRRRR